MTDYKIGAAYIRVSTDDQVEYSPDSQIAKIMECAKREGVIIPPEYIYRDDGISGKSAEKRPAFLSMIAASKESPPPFAVIYVWEYSRFTRNQEESIFYKKLLAKNGVALRSIKEPMLDSPFSSLIESIIAWMDEYYLVNLATEVRRGMKEKALRGECMAAAPFGYTVHEKSFIANENADIVRYLFEQFAAGKGMRTLAQEMNARGVITRRGRAPDSRWVKYLLENPVYIGKVRWSTEGRARYSSSDYNSANVMMVDGTHAPIISRELWEKVQERLKKPGSEVKYARRDSEPYMLRGLIKCSACGATLTRGSRASRMSLQCCRYNRGQCRTSHHIYVDKAEDTVISQLRVMVASKSFIFSPSKPTRAAASCDWDKLIAQEQARLKRAKNAYLDGAFTSDEYKEIKQAAESKIAKLEESRSAETKTATIDTAAFARAVSAVLETVTSETVPADQKCAALHSVIDKIVYVKAENRFDFFFIP